MLESDTIFSMDTGSNMHHAPKHVYLNDALQSQGSKKKKKREIYQLDAKKKKKIK